MKIACFTKQTMHLFDGINPYADQARLRYQAFRPFNWDVPYFKEEEWEEDQFDVPPNTIYFVCYDDHGEPLASARMVRTDQDFRLCKDSRSFMLKDIFNTESLNLLYPGQEVPRGKSILEGSRLAFSPKLLTPDKKPERDLVGTWITLSIFEECNRLGIEKFVGVMHPKVWESVWLRRGCEYEFLGPVVEVMETEHNPHDVLRAATVYTSREHFLKVQETTGYNHSILDYGRSAEPSMHLGEFCYVPVPEIGLTRNP